MGWVIAFKEKQTGKIVVVQRGTIVDADDPQFEDDSHILPVSEVVMNGVRKLFLGAHTLNRNCYCSPEVQESVWDRNLVIHKEEVN